MTEATRAFLHWAEGYFSAYPVMVKAEVAKYLDAQDAERGAKFLEAIREEIRLGYDAGWSRVPPDVRAIHGFRAKAIDRWWSGRKTVALPAPEELMDRKEVARKMHEMIDDLVHRRCPECHIGGGNHALSCSHHVDAGRDA